MCLAREPCGGPWGARLRSRLDSRSKLLVTLSISLGLAACGGGDDTAVAPSDTSDISDTGTAGDGDGDGVGVDDGDCDDGDPAVYPGAEESGGDGLDQDCDGSDFVATEVGSVAVALLPPGPGLGYGSVLSAADLAGQPYLAVSGPGSRQPGIVQVFTGGVAMGGGAPFQTYTHEDMSSFGQATALLMLDDGAAAVAVGFSDISDYGGVCAWDLAVAGGGGPEQAAGCTPAFENDVQERVGYGFATRVDLDGDGLADLAMQGMAAATLGDGEGAVWYVPGPLTPASFAASPTLLFGDAEGSEPGVIADPGDLDGDGYDDLAVADSSYAGDRGAVFVLSGSAVPTAYPPDSPVALLGDIPEDRFGAAMAFPDLDGDGWLDVCASAPHQSINGREAGTAGCFFGPLAGVQDYGSAPVRFSSETDEEHFGTALAALDTGADGIDALVIATKASSGGLPGKVFVFDATDTVTPALLLRGETDDRMGSAMVVHDLDADGRDDLVVGAPSAEIGDATSGLAYVISGASGAW